MNNCALVNFLIVAVTGFVLMKNQPNAELIKQNTALADKLAAAKEAPYKAQIAMLEAEKKSLKEELKSCK